LAAEVASPPKVLSAFAPVTNGLGELLFAVIVRIVRPLWPGWRRIFGQRLQRDGYGPFELRIASGTPRLRVKLHFDVSATPRFSISHFPSRE
jgi:hypothetical protein